MGGCDKFVAGVWILGVGRLVIWDASATIEPPMSSQLASPEANLQIELWSALMGMASSFGLLRRAECSSTIWHKTSVSCVLLSIDQEILGLTSLPKPGKLRVS